MDEPSELDIGRNKERTTQQNEFIKELHIDSKTLNAHFFVRDIADLVRPLFLLPSAYLLARPLTRRILRIDSTAMWSSLIWEVGLRRETGPDSCSTRSPHTRS